MFVYLQVFVQCTWQEPDCHRAESWFACGNTPFNFGDSHLGWPEWWFRIWVSFCCASSGNAVTTLHGTDFLHCVIIEHLYLMTYDNMTCLFILLASFWRRTCWCFSCGLCDKRMVDKYVFSYYKLWTYYLRTSAMKLQSVSILDHIDGYILLSSHVDHIHVPSILLSCG